MNRRHLIKQGTIWGLGVLGPPMLKLGRCLLAAEPEIEVSTRAVDLVSETSVVDMLSLLTLDWPKLFRWQRTPGAFVERVRRMAAAGGVMGITVVRSFVGRNSRPTLDDLLDHFDQGTREGTADRPVHATGFLCYHAGRSSLRENGSCIRAWLWMAQDQRILPGLGFSGGSRRDQQLGRI